MKQKLCFSFLIKDKPVMNFFYRIFYTTLLLVVMLTVCSYCENNLLSTTEQIPKDIQNTIITVVEKLQPALVRIHVVEKYYSEGRELKQEKFGSGIVISEDGYVVTNHHVAGKAFIADCTFSNLKNYPMKLIGTDALTDISVLKIVTNEPNQFSYASFGDSEQVKVGDYVLAMGSPMALSPSVTAGIVSNKQMILPYKLDSFEFFSEENENVGSLVCWLGHNAEISPGSSGGPLINLRGEIIGINEIKYALGGAIPSNLVKKVVEDIVKNGKVERAWLGVEIQPVTQEKINQKGALVRYVYPNSPADNAGVKVGDIIEQIRDITVDVRYMEQIPLVNNIICSLPCNEKIPIQIIRNSEKLDIVVEPIPYDFPITPEKEFPEWGCTAKNMNWFLALKRNRENQKGIIITSIRMGGAVAQAKPPLQTGDIVLQVEDMHITCLDEMERVTQQFLGEKKEKLLTIVERKGNRIYSMVKIGKTQSVEPIREASKPWIGVETQVLTRDIAEKMGIEEGGFIITRVFYPKIKEVKDLNVGDIVKEIENEKLHATRVEEYEEWKEKIRNFSIGQIVNLSVIRKGDRKIIPVQLVSEPIPRGMLEKYQDDWLEFTVRDLCFYDYVDMNLSDDIKGIYIEQVISGGWASLAKLEQGDVIIAVENEPIDNLNTFKIKLAKLKENKLNKFSFQILRGIQKYFVEIEIK